MAQDWQDIPATETLENSRALILGRDDSLKTAFSGTAFPTTDLDVGQFCYRTDQEKLYELRSIGPDTWVMIADLTKTPLFSSDVGTAAAANTGTGASDVPTITQADARYALLSGATFSGLTRINATLRAGSTAGQGGILSLLGADGGTEATTGALIDVTAANLLRILSGVSGGGLQVYSRSAAGTLDLGTNNASRLLLLANGDVRHKTGKFQFGYDALTTKDLFYLTALAADKPQILFDTGDYIIYDRTNNAFDFYVGGVAKARLNGTGMAIGGTSVSEVLTLSGNASVTRLLAGAGTVLLPSISLAGDPNTGFYGISADKIGVSANGLLVASFDANKKLQVHGDSGAADDALTVKDKFFLGAASATKPIVNFDDDDRISYDRANNKLEVIIGGESKLEVSSSGITSGGVAVGGGGWSLIESRTLAVGTGEIFTGLAGWEDIMVECVAINKSGSGASTISLQLSTDNGVTFLSAATSYFAFEVAKNIVAGSDALQSGVLSYMPIGYTTGQDDQNCKAIIQGFGGSKFLTWDMVSWIGNFTSIRNGIGRGYVLGQTAYNAIKVFPTGAAWDSSGSGWGTINIYGRS